MRMKNILCYIVTDMTLRKSLFSNLNINSDYCDTNHVHVDKTLSGTLRCLLYPIDIQETKTICHFIQSAFSIHCSSIQFNSLLILTFFNLILYYLL